MEKHTFFDAIDPDIARRIASRREALRKAGKLGAGLALASIPASFGLFARSAFGRALPPSVEEVLRFALTLEYLEYEFYNTAVGTSGLIPGPAQDFFLTVRNHELAHVRLLEGALGLAEDEAKPEFDFTAGGMFDPFTNYNTFLVLSQGFEDTGVRAYKGGAPALIGNPGVLRTALQIHSVEARHASVVRRLRGLDGWISFDDNEVPALQHVYDGEENTTHLGVDVRALTVKSVEAITEAYDEPLTMDEVLAIAGPFIVS